MLHPVDLMAWFRCKCKHSLRKIKVRFVKPNWISLLSLIGTVKKTMKNALYQQNSVELLSKNDCSLLFLFFPSCLITFLIADDKK